MLTGTTACSSMQATGTLLLHSARICPKTVFGTIDLVVVSRHILNIQLLDSPYKMIAADVNKSGNINTMDLVETRKLILHIDDEFRNNNSWRFIDKAFAFADPTKPFATAFPESISGPAPGLKHDFIGMKVGDVSGDAVVD